LESNSRGTGSWASYRCPVCSHTDRAPFPAGAGAIRFPCSHCGVGLEADSPHAAVEHLDVRVRPEEGSGGNRDTDGEDSP
jgi:hypothetical protein